MHTHTHRGWPHSPNQCHTHSHQMHCLMADSRTLKKEGGREWETKLLSKTTHKTPFREDWTVRPSRSLKKATDDYGWEKNRVGVTSFSVVMCLW